MSTEDLNSYSEPQSTGAPDAVETDPAGLNSAEDLDEDRIRKDPLESGMDPPEQWSGVTKYGMTPWEESHPRPLADRLAEERPDVTADEPAGEPVGEPVDQEDGVVSRDAVDDPEADTRTEAARRGQVADGD
ncbi:hypothetical protein FHS29_004590 [Saccharothrix tamanrassetensis]|uniref:DUF5709 domain-containing protein n=1 Tax=Saccharothrix tamanrassetensis TaxID=1051531 RepID=A0A841CHG3_9PSEU|nr:hypothetical protein [Saccharothrix tamanrassetensis]MBB5957982.1 hypothetical protein [Saccharothrix tamanrassetensis]